MGTPNPDSAAQHYLEHLESIHLRGDASPNPHHLDA
jgi:hypothetical protein